MAISFTNLGNSANPDLASSGSGTSFSNSSWTPPTSGLILAFIGSKRSGALPSEPTSLTGNGITWTKIGSSANSTANIRVTLYGANASGSSTGATTVSFGAETQFRGFMSFFLAEGIDLSGGVAAAFVQAPTNTADASGSISITLSAAGASGNLPVAGFILDASDAITPTWTEVDEMTNSRNLETQWKSDSFSTTASASIAVGTNYWAGIAAELKAEITTSIKTINGLAKASVKTYNGLAIANVKTINGLV